MRIAKCKFSRNDFAVLISHFSMLSRYNKTLRGMRFSPAQAEPRYPDIPIGFLSFLSFSNRAGFDEEPELVARFGQARRQLVQLPAQRLHRLGVTWGTQLIQMHLDHS